MTIKIGENIKKFRKTSGITQEKLAEVFNVSPVAVCKWETGESYPDITLLPSIASIFEVTIDELLGYKLSEREQDLANIKKKMDHF